MTTILSHGPYSASVIIEGAAVPQYKITTNEATKTTEAYIESTPGKAFELQYAVASHGHPFEKTSFRTHLDGDCTGGEIPFLFAKLETTDNDDEVNASETFMKGLGMIRVTVHEVTNGKKSKDRGTTTNGPGSSKIHEKAPKKKLMSEMTKLGDAVSGSKHSWKKYTYIDPKDKPYWTFLFIYRSRALLELIQGIDLPMLPVAPEAEGTPDHSASPEPIPQKDKKPLIKRPHQTVVISDDDEEDVKPRVKMPRKSNGPTEVVVIE